MSTLVKAVLATTVMSPTTLASPAIAGEQQRPSPLLIPVLSQTRTTH